uniref:BED-type domain-containing protein n=1 Tax=Strongyloides stercoralis TaxID=6248 RepID=A0A0K0E354_STRER
MDILMTSNNEHSCSSSTAKHKFMETARKHSNYQDDETASSSSSNSEGGFTEDNEHQNTIDKLSFQKNKDIMVSLANELGGNVNGHFDLSTTNPEFLALLTKSFVESKEIPSATGQQQQQTPSTAILTASNGKTGVINNNNIKNIDCLMKSSSNNNNNNSSHQMVLGIIGDDTSSNGSIEGTENLESTDCGNRSSPSDDYHQNNNRESRGSSQQPDGSILQGNGLKQIVNGTSPWMRSAGRKKTHPVWQFFKDLKDCGLDENGVICLNCDWKGDDKSPNNLKTHLKRCHEHDGIYEKFTQALAKVCFIYIKN